MKATNEQGSIIEGKLTSAVVVSIGGIQFLVGYAHEFRGGSVESGTIFATRVIQFKGRDIAHTERGVLRFHLDVPPSSERVKIAMTLSEAGDLSFALSDLLCWHQGYAAAKGDDNSNAPMGVNEAREFNIKLKRAIREASGD